ncbi:MAG: M48 family metalloprotease [Desulfobulbaceae bacterium]|nr:M48 family metalloprotease [Desulfobulbaceae bacterium]
MMPRKNKICTLLVAFLCLLVAFQPAAALTIGEEREIGQKLLYTIRSHFKLLDDPDIAQYINNLGQKILAEAGPQYFDYHFFVVPSDEFNAFAAPSGLIFFYTGLIETMKTEDELLSVMAHEIGHVVSRHISSRSSKGGKVSAISMALALASLALGDPSLSAGLFTGFQAAGLSAELHFSRVDEEEADRLSYDWMKSLHRDPRAMESMLGTMRRITRYRSEQIPQYLLTHPNPEARLQYVQSLLDYEENKNMQEYRETDNFDFLRIKYRILISVKDQHKVRAYLANTLASSNNPEDRAMATYGLALLQARELNFSQALENLAAVKKHFPDRTVLDIDTGILYLDSGENETGLALLEKAYQKEPENMYAAFHLARAYEKKGQVGLAESLYTRIVKVLPENSQVYFELGRIKAGSGRTGESNYYLGKYYLYEGKSELARDYFLQVKADSSVPHSLRQEAEELLSLIDELEK